MYNLYIQFLSHLKPRPKPQLMASKILSLGRRLFKPLSQLSMAYGYPISARLGLRLQAKPHHYQQPCFSPLFPRFHLYSVSLCSFSISIRSLFLSVRSPFLSDSCLYPFLPVQSAGRSAALPPIKLPITDRLCLATTPLMNIEVIRRQSSPIFAFAKTKHNKRALGGQPANRN